LVKVSSARHWKAISGKLTVNFEGMELEEASTPSNEVHHTENKLGNNLLLMVEV